MRKFKIAAALALVTTCALAADSPFAGTWKLDPAKGHYTGTTYTFKQLPNGFILADFGSFSYKFKTNGHDYPVVGDSTVSWTQTGPNSWHMVNKIGGKAQPQEDSFTVSPDNKTATFATQGKSEDGTPFKNATTFQRVAGSSGMLGTWKTQQTKLDNDATLVITTPQPGVVRLDYKHAKQVVDGKTDGTPVKVTSAHPEMDKHFGGTLMASGTHTISYTNTMDGKLVTKGIMRVSADGKSLTDTSWDPAKPTEKTMDYYNKQ